MAKIKNRRREASAAVMNKIPLVSVIIPMYNSAKFIPQTLESLLYQTMTDFEVVVVDDCSTDNSVEVVESFSERFGGRLHVVKLKKNTGTPGLPRNVGINFACGKYIAFLDSDDLYTKTALEELSTLAEKYQAEVIHLHRNFILWGGEYKSVDEPSMTNFAELTNPKNFSVQTYRNEQLKEPTLETEDIAVRVRKWIDIPRSDFWATWLLFYRRDFLVSNQIQFPPMSTSEDSPFAFKAMCLAKKYLQAPNLVNIIRPRLNSISRDWQNLSLDKHLHKRLGALADGVNEFERVMGEIAFFKEHPDYRYTVLAWFANYRISLMSGLYAKVPAFQLNDPIKKEFHSDDAALAAYLFNTVNVYRLQIMKLQQELNALKGSR